MGPVGLVMMWNGDRLMMAAGPPLGLMAVARELAAPHTDDYIPARAPAGRTVAFTKL